MDFVAVDLGASNTRFTSIDQKINFLPNNVQFVDINKELDIEKLSDVLEDNLDVTITKEGQSEYFPMRALVGTLSTRIEGVQSTPSQLKNKVKQPINYLSTVLAIAVSKVKNPNIGEEVNLFSTLPPAEVAMHKKLFSDNLVGKYTVSFNKLGITTQFSIKNVYCYEESRMAIIQYLFDAAHPERLAKYAGCNILSIDIGASTTDLAIFANRVYLDKTGRTFKIGGNSVRDNIIKSINAMNGVNMSNAEADQCLIEGRMKYGNKYVAVTDIVDAAKEMVAREIIRQFDLYFNSINMSLMSINYIIVSGGGSMGSSYVDDDGIRKDTSKPMSEYITTALKDICDGIDVEYFGDEPRTANIRGLGMFANLCHGEVNS